MRGQFLKDHHQTISRFLQKGARLLFFMTAAVIPGCKKGVSPTAVETSAAGQLARYDFNSGDYDVTPITTYTASYNSSGEIMNFFEKSGQTLFSYSLAYNGDKLSNSIANNLGVQSFVYNAAGKPEQINYTTLTDTGKRVFTYDAAGKLTAITDSVKQPSKLPARFQYLYTYDAGGNNVVQIQKNQLDLQGRPTLRQYNIYTFDDKGNPFTAFPWLLDSSSLPGDVPALINKNNVTGIQLVGTILNTSSGGLVPVLDTITIYRATRNYEYNAKGFPVKAHEKFNDIQFNYSGNRTFTYEY